MPPSSRPPSLPSTAKAVSKSVGKVAERAVGKAAARATGKPRARAPHLGPEKRRPMILDAAFEVFLEKGYEGASMEAIARRAGVSKPVVYSSFKGKDALFGELLKREERRILDAIASALPEAMERSSDLGVVISDAVTALLEAVQDAPSAFQVVFLGTGGADAAISRRVQRGREMQIEAIAGLSRQWREQHHLPDAEDQALLDGHLLTGLAESAARALLAEPDRWTPRQLGDRVAQMVAGGGLGRAPAAR